MPFLQRYTLRPVGNVPVPLNLPVADCITTEQQEGGQNELNAFADAKVCTPNNGRCKDTDEEESIVKAVCLSSLIAEEKYDVEGIVYLTNSSSVSVDDETVVVDEPDRNEQIV